MEGGSSAPAGMMGGPTATGWSHFGSENTYREIFQEYRQKLGPWSRGQSSWETMKHLLGVRISML